MHRIKDYIGNSDGLPLINYKLKMGHRKYNNIMLEMDKGLLNSDANHIKYVLKGDYKQTMNIPEIKIFDFIKNENYYALIDKDILGLLNKNLNISKKRLSKKIGVSYQTIQRILSKEDYWANLAALLRLCKELSVNQNTFLNKIDKVKTKNSFPFEIKNFKISKSMMRLLGHIIGDGGIHIRKKDRIYRAFYVNNEKVLLNSFKIDIESVFGNVKLYFRKRIKHGDEIWLQTSIGFIFYVMLNYRSNNNKKRVPKILYNFEEGLICPFLQALYDDEGFIYPKKYMIVIAQASRKLLEDIRRLIIKIDIQPNKILVHKSKDRTKMYYFSITHKENIKKFYEKINFKHPTKKKKLEILYNKYKR